MAASSSPRRWTSGPTSAASELDFSRSGKPTDDANVESFNGRLRDECLSVEWFRSRDEARVVIEAWRRHYNAVRPHSSLNYLTPLQFKQHHQPIPNRAVLQE